MATSTGASSEMPAFPGKLEGSSEAAHRCSTMHWSVKSKTVNCFVFFSIFSCSQSNSLHLATYLNASYAEQNTGPPTESNMSKLPEHETSMETTSDCSEVLAGPTPRSSSRSSSKAGHGPGMGDMAMAEELDGIKAEHVKRMDGLDRDLERHAAFLEDLDDTKAEHDKKIEHLEKEVERHERIVAEVRASNEDLQSQIRRVHNKVQEWHDTSFNPRTIGWFFPNLSEKGGARALNLQVDDVLYEDVESFIEAVEAARRTGTGRRHVAESPQVLRRQLSRVVHIYPQRNPARRSHG
ncbi:hypothetical protein IWX50DRAFT_612875 [Phyllosticta citricarpa]|uniref:Uncharacterized protein n=1 Tax=Phyllosticta citricarpa TaxID=55181 RepID=A0ABR1MLP1_9PEZI